MKGFFHYLPPFAPDYSGAVSALYNAGGLVVLCDPGGCSGNVAGYDEPRFFGSGASFYSAAIRELDTIFGRDDRLEQKVISAAALGDYEFIALVGTPVVSVIGTDLSAVAKKIEKAVGISAFAVTTTGMEDYSHGEEKAIKAFTEKFISPEIKPSGELVGVFGATPLNSAGDDDLIELTDTENAVFLSEPGAVKALSEMNFSRLLCLSPGGMPACKRLHEKFGLPFTMQYPKSPALIAAADAAKGAKRILVIHQQAAANRLREMLLDDGAEAVAVGSFFRGWDEAASPGDMVFNGEDEVTKAAKDFDVVIADPLYSRTLGNTPLIPLAHRALSGGMYV